jgi:methyltransferase FkbM-like protein
LGLPGFNCLDVGGQFGYDALVLAKLSGGRVMSFECDPTASSELARNVANNAPFRDNIRVVHAFVTAQTNGERGQIALDDVAFDGEGFVPDFIKMDIEGAELDALRGARRILEERHPNLLVETHSRQLEIDCLTFVESLGYGTRVLSPRLWLRDYRPVEHNRWFAATYDRGVNDRRSGCSGDVAPTSR